MKSLKILIMALVVQGCVSKQAYVQTTSVRKDSEYIKTWEKKYSISILPPIVEIYETPKHKNHIKGQELLAFLVPNLTNELENKGYIVKKNINSIEDYDLNGIFSHYDKISKEHLYKSIDLENDIAYATKSSIDIDTNVLSKQLGTNLVLVTRYIYVPESDVRKRTFFVLDMIMRTQPGYYNHVTQSNNKAVLDAVIIDLSNGKIFWSNKLVQNSDFMSQMLKNSTSKSNMNFILKEVPFPENKQILSGEAVGANKDKKNPIIDK